MSRNSDPTADDNPTTADEPTRQAAATQNGVLSETTLTRSFPNYAGQIVESRRLPARDADTVPAESVLPAPLAEQLDVDLFSHQATALEQLENGDNVVVTTSTSSGKTWIYALQIARAHLANPDATALCLFPMKALTRDQERTLNDKLADDWGLDITVGVYDGDTPSDRKQAIRETADVILTNPAGLNVYLPRHNRDSGWHRFYTNLELVVVDEAHEYSGVTGTHVAWILRRLRRILSYYDTDPQSVLTTATIGNPAAHAARLTGVDHSVVDTDGSPRGARDVVLWRPPLDTSALEATPENGDGIADFEAARRSTGAEAASVTAHLASLDTQTLQFCSARQGTEIGARQVHNSASSHPATSGPGDVSVEPYHAGLGKQSRRAVENQLKSAAVDAVTSTNALELGIDIGSVDATVTSSYPGTRQSFWQQVGRAGRGTSDALSVLVAGSDAMDAYIFSEPSYLFDSAVENAVVSVDNDRVFADHLLAAADERPLTLADADHFGGERRLREMVQMWQEAGALESPARLDGRGVTYTGDRRPQSRISLYGTGGTEFRVVCEDGEIDHDPVAEERAYRDFHEGALFLHGGQQYEVTSVERTGRYPTIRVHQRATDEYTQTLSDKTVHSLEVRDHTPLDGEYELYFGRGTITITYDRYVVRSVSSGDLVEGPLATGSPPIDIRTELMWVSLPEDHLQRTVPRLEDGLLETNNSADGGRELPMSNERYTYAGGLHAAEHGVIQLAPLELLIDNSDIGGLSTLRHSHETIPGPTWFVHDGIDGGIGFSRAIYQQFESLASRTREHIQECDCGRRRGCPLCVQSEDCGNSNDPLDRASARHILDDVLDAFPDQ